MSPAEGSPDEDVSHIVVRGQLPAVVGALDSYLASNGYKRIGLRGQVHLLKRVDWASPFSPPPEYRCFIVLSLEPDFVSVVDELDRTDWSLALAMANTLPAWVFRGWRELEQFEWSSPSGRSSATVPALSPESTALLRLSYDDLALVARSPTHTVVGYSHGRPYPLDPRGADR